MHQNPEKKTCGDKIKFYRTQQKLTQKQLAEKAMIATISIQQYESNTRNPKIETLQRIASALNVPVNALRSDTDLEYDELQTMLTDWLEAAYQKSLFEHKFTFEQLQAIISGSVKHLTIEQKQTLMKILLSTD